MDKTPIRKLKSLLAGRVKLSRDKKPLYMPGGNLTGVCAGLGKFFGINPLVFRILFGAGAIMSGFMGVLVYGLFALFLPDQDGNSLFEEFRQMRKQPPKQIFEGEKRFVLCENCDTAVKEGSKYCHSCGKKL